MFTESLFFILENKIFQFKNVFFKQTKGPEMGTKVASTYAIHTTDVLEHKLYKRVGESFNKKK